MDDSKAFEDWLRERWAEKDQLIEQFLQTGRFPADEGDKPVAMADGFSEGKLGPGGSRYIETGVQCKSSLEFLVIFAPLAAYIIVGYGLVWSWRFLQG